MNEDERAATEKFINTYRIGTPIPASRWVGKMVRLTL